MKRRFGAARSARALFIVPLPVVFEVANHIAGMPEGQRYERARTFVADIVDSIRATREIFLVSPSPKPEDVTRLLEVFASDYVGRGIGLVDTAVIDEARRLKAKFAKPSVHIWTLDHALKAGEPDPEPDPFLG